MDPVLEAFKEQNRVERDKENKKHQKELFEISSKARYQDAINEIALDQVSRYVSPFSGKSK